MRATRRGFLKATAAGSTAGLVLPSVQGGDLVRLENSKPGARDWLLTKTRVDGAAKWRCPWIEGYCSHASVKAGETLKFFVSTNPASAFTLDIFRLGYYGGAGGRQVGSMGPFAGRIQADPPVGEKRLRDCAWEVSAEIKIPADWLSGVYLGKLTECREGIQSYVIFIVRDDRQADFLFQCSDHTWQSYNRWPDHFSLYDDGKSDWYWGGGVKVSFNRPYGKYCQIFDVPVSTGSGEFLLWEFPLAFWLEEHGYDVTYISNVDTHRDRGGLTRARGLLSVGHDEYWTLEMYDNVRATIDAGVSVLFLSGNTCCGRIAYGRRHRAFERIDVFGPADTEMRFVAMNTLPHTSPWAKNLIGAHSVWPVTGGADWTCVKPEHWLFESTGMKKGDAIPGLVGWEWHGDPATDIPGLEIVAAGPTQSAPGKLNGGQFVATIYPAPKKNFVFNASTIWWSLGLSEPPGFMRPTAYTTPCPNGPDTRVQTITRNLLNRVLG
ncbi:MAG: N,N-dimethylformamidase beta subunit family domain-containing protein [Verrucomicrobiales bacterium]